MLLFPGMTERTSQVLEEWLWGPLGVKGLHVYEHQAEQVTEPRQFDFLSLRVIGEEVCTKSVLELRKPELQT